MPKTLGSTPSSIAIRQRSAFIVCASLLGCLALATPSGVSSLIGGLRSFAANLVNNTSVRHMAASQQGQRPRPTPCNSCPPPSPRRIYAPAVEMREAERSEIVLNSRSPNPLDVTPTFYTATGDAVVGEAVRLQPAEIRFVPVEQLIPEGLRGRHRWGGIALSYTGGVLEVWAQITFHGVGGSGSIDETFNILEEPGSDTREAVWRMPKKGAAIIALGNSSAVAIHTAVQFSGDDTEEVDIPAGVTKFIRRRGRQDDDKRSNGESVKLTTVGPDGSLRVAGFIIAEDENFFSSIRFTDPKKTAQPNLYATNLRLGNTVPRMVLKNTGEVDVSVRPRFFSAAGEDGNPVELPTMRLRPQQIVDVDLRTLREAAASRPDFDFVSVQVLNSGAPGSLIGALYSTDRITQLTYDVPLRDSGKMRNSTGSYPWRVDGDYTTIVNITNVTGQPASFIVDIRYPGGHYFLPSREIAAGGTATFDLRELIGEQKADNKGDVIPLATKGGQFHWSVFGGAASSKFIGRSEVVSLFQRVTSSYSCPSCCPDSGPFGGIDTPGPVFIAGPTTVGTHSEMIDCNGYPTFIGNLWMNWWWMSNYNVASCNPRTGVSTDLQGVNVGQTYINGTWTTYSWDPGPDDCYRSNWDGSDSQPVDVVSVVLALRSSGSVSSDNGALSTYSSTLGTTNLGVFFSNGTGNHLWRVSGVQITGTVIPSSYTGTVVIHRLIIESRSYTDSNSTPSQTITNQDDTSAQFLRDDDPQSGGSNGKVYDLDAPGIGLASNAPVGSIIRRRVNFVEYTTVGGVTLPNSILYWYSRESVIKTSTGDQLLNDISGDNTVGSGSTALTWNLQ